MNPWKTDLKTSNVLRVASIMIHVIKVENLNVLSAVTQKINHLMI